MEKIEEQPEPIDPATLLASFKQLLVELDQLGGWDARTASQLSWINRRRHTLGSQLRELGKADFTAYVFGSEETDREVAIAQHTRPKRKSELAGNEAYYYRAIRHLKEEIGEYIEKLK